MRCIRLPAAALTILPLLGACASTDGKYPSLARRDIERTAAAPVPAPSPTPLAPLSEAIRARAAQLAAEARAAHDRFTARQVDATRAVTGASGAAVASESWSIATVALARLEAARSETMVALAGLDRIYVDERMAGSDVTPLGELIAEVRRLLDQEDSAIAVLGGRLRT